MRRCLVPIINDKDGRDDGSKLELLTCAILKNQKAQVRISEVAWARGPAALASLFSSSPEMLKFRYKFQALEPFHGDSRAL